MLLCRFQSDSLRPRPRRSPSSIVQTSLADNWAVLTWFIIVLVCPSIAPRVAFARSDERIALSGQVELPRLLDLCAEQLALTIDYDPSVVTGSFALRSAQPLTTEELWALTTRVLALRGFAVVASGEPNSKARSIVRMPDAAGLAPVHILKPQESMAGFTSCVLRIEHHPTKVIADAVRPILSKPNGSIIELGVGGLVFLADTSSRLTAAIDVINRLDIPGTEPVVERVQTQFASPSSLSAMCTSASAARDSMSALPLKGRVLPTQGEDAVILVCPAWELQTWREMIRQFDKQEPVRTVSYSPKHFGVVEVGKLIEQITNNHTRQHQDNWATRIRIVTDDLTGTLMVTATDSQHHAVAELVNRLDTSPVEARRPLRTFVIRNRPAAEIEQLITELLAEGVFGSPEIQADGAALGDTPEIRSPLHDSSASSQLTSASSQTTTRPATTFGAGSARSNTERRNVSERQCLLSVDEGTNMLIAVGSSRLLAQIEELVRTLDVRQAQVMIDVTVVGLTDSDTLDLGVELKKIEINGDIAISL